MLTATNVIKKRHQIVNIFFLILHFDIISSNEWSSKQLVDTSVCMSACNVTLIDKKDIKT